jgi:hypothetical protein
MGRHFPLWVVFASPKLGGLFQRRQYPIEFAVIVTRSLVGTDDAPILALSWSGARNGSLPEPEGQAGSSPYGGSDCLGAL